MQYYQKIPIHVIEGREMLVLAEKIIIRFFNPRIKKTTKGCIVTPLVEGVFMLFLGIQFEFL